MSQFGSPLPGLANGGKLTDAELVRAIRFMVAAESETTRLYAQLAASTDNERAVEALEAIADQQLVNVGAFLRLLRELVWSDERLYAGRAKEEAAGTLRRMRQTTAITRIVVPTM